MFHKYLLCSALDIGIKLTPGVEDKYNEIIDNMIALIKEILVKLIKGGSDISIYVLRPLYILLIVLGIAKYALSGFSQK